MDVQNKIFVSPGVTKLAFWVYPSSPFLTSVLPLVEDLEVHDSGQSADNQLIALGPGLWSFEDSHSGPVIPVQVILRRGFKASKKYIRRAVMAKPQVTVGLSVCCFRIADVQQGDLGLHC